MWIEVTATNLFVNYPEKIKLNKYHITSFHSLFTHPSGLLRKENGVRIYMNNGECYEVLETYKIIENLLKGEQNAKCE